MATQPRLETDEQEVLAANQAFYEALQSLDLSRMEAVWLQEDWVRCLHPGWDLITGWEDIRESWSNIFRSTGQMRVEVGRTLVHVQDDVAWVSCIENVTSAFEGGFSTAMIEATNIFVRRSSQWRMVHHHTTPLPDRVPLGTSRTVQ
ncbi:MAG: nuclear transport factor 2 family protein [Acidobacteria bacterium]|nr:nuclear transport factor 2 family protein [Acidobacteriota bacterium]